MDKVKTKDDLAQDVLEKIENRMEFKIDFETLNMWNVVVKDDRDFRILIMGLHKYCKHMEIPDFSGAKDPAMLKQLFQIEARKQGFKAVKYAEMCINNVRSGKKGGLSRAKKAAQASASERLRSQADIDYDLDSESGSDIEDIDIGTDINPASLVLTDSSPDEGKELPNDFWEDSHV